MVLAIQVKGSNNLKAMADALRKADREDLRRGLDRAIRTAAKPTVEAIRESARNIQTKGQRRPPSRFVDTRKHALRARERADLTDVVVAGLTGLSHPFTAKLPPKGTREKIAKAVSADVSTAGENPRVSFRVRNSRLPEVLRGMPRKFDSGKWRHPVMGNRDVWVGQTSDPWFFPPIKKSLDTFRAAIDAELDKVRANLEAS